MINPSITNEGCSLRLVLITNGLRPVSRRFAALQGQPIGVVSWYGAESGGLVKHIERFKLLARCYARLRKRQYVSLSHLCRENNLLYTRIQKSKHEALHDVLAYCLHKKSVIGRACYSHDSPKLKIKVY